MLANGRQYLMGDPPAKGVQLLDSLAEIGGVRILYPAGIGLLGLHREQQIVKAGLADEDDIANTGGCADRDDRFIFIGNTGQTSVVVGIAKHRAHIFPGKPGDAIPLDGPDFPFSIEENL